MDLGTHVRQIRHKKRVDSELSTSAFDLATAASIVEGHFVNVYTISGCKLHPLDWGRGSIPWTLCHQWCIQLRLAIYVHCYGEYCGYWLRRRPQWRIFFANIVDGSNSYVAVKYIWWTLEPIERDPQIRIIINMDSHVSRYDCPNEWV